MFDGRASGSVCVTDNHASATVNRIRSKEERSRTTYICLAEVAGSFEVNVHDALAYIGQEISARRESVKIPPSVHELTATCTSVRGHSCEPPCHGH
jgi:hypothetical protein